LAATKTCSLIVKKSGKWQPRELQIAYIESARPVGRTYQAWEFYRDGTGFFNGLAHFSAVPESQAGSTTGDGTQAITPR